LTRKVNTEQTSNDRVYFSDLEHYRELFERIKKPQQKLFLIGGGIIYDLLWKQCDVLHITHIYDNKSGNIKWNASYNEIEELFDKKKDVHKHCDESGIDYSFIEYEKKCVV
jgi:dihydrofolate reductase